MHGGKGRKVHLQHWTSAPSTQQNYGEKLETLCSYD
jgi:hypothetical protein